MNDRSPPPLADLTTLGVGGPPTELVTAATTERIIEAVTQADATGRPLLVLGGGSNVVVGDEGFDGVVVRIGTEGRHVVSNSDTAWVTAQAGEEWGRLVDFCVAHSLAGIECLAGIPGLVGATPIQNVGAYGQEIAQTVTAVHAWDRRLTRRVTLDKADCQFGYRDSRFKREGDHVILGVTLKLRRTERAEPIRYDGLAKSLAVDLGDQLPLAQVRDAVLALRRSKGMVLDGGDLDTRSAGSFFTNPVLTAADLSGLRERAEARVGTGITVPSYPDGADRHKVPAAWLIEQAGFSRGYRLGSAAISTKHTLALTVRRGHSARDLIALAREVRDGVRATFGITLVAEPVLIGIEL